MAAPSPIAGARGLWVAAWLVAGLALTAGRADAGCGEHVTVRRAGPVATDAPPPTPPCHGSVCSAGPASPVRPPATAPAPRPVDPDPAAVLAVAPAVEAVGVVRPGAEPAGRPVRRATDQFRPPRHV